MNMIEESMYDRYQVGDAVRIIHGALEGFVGIFYCFDRQTGMVCVHTIFFGRVTPVDLEFSEIEKLSE